MGITSLGRYQIVRQLGSGAMGQVYEAMDPKLKRRVAIKTIRVEHLDGDLADMVVERFAIEASAAGRLEHPNIVKVHDADNDGVTAYLVLELVDGEDLKTRLDRAGRLSLEDALAIMHQLLAALGYAHANAIVHRDVKPANIFIDRQGRLKLGDFGAARIAEPIDLSLTQGTMIGTLKYMSPEQLAGQPVDARTDIFAAGVVLYQMLTGLRPFDGGTDFEVMQRIVQQDPVAATAVAPGLPAAIDGILRRALAKNRAQRYATAEDFDAALRQLASEAAGVPGHGLAANADARGRGRVRVTSAVVVMVVAVPALILLLADGRRQMRSPTSESAALAPVHVSAAEVAASKVGSEASSADAADDLPPRSARPSDPLPTFGGRAIGLTAESAPPLVKAGQVDSADRPASGDAGQQSIDAALRSVARMDGRSADPAARAASASNKHRTPMAAVGRSAQDPVAASPARAALESARPRPDAVGASAMSVPLRANSDPGAMPPPRASGSDSPPRFDRAGTDAVQRQERIDAAAEAASVSASPVPPTPASPAGSRRPDRLPPTW